jgi:hypothetical protein
MDPTHPLAEPFRVLELAAAEGAFRHPADFPCATGPITSWLTRVWYRLGDGAARYLLIELHHSWCKGIAAAADDPAKLLELARGVVREAEALEADQVV